MRAVAKGTGSHEGTRLAELAGCMIFELLFLFGVLVSLICLIAALVLAVRARHPAAKRLLKVLGTGWIAYLSVVFLLAAATAQQVVPTNQDLCFDEMCFAVVHAQAVPQLGSASRPVRANGIFHIVTVRVSSHARGRPQSESGLRALLWSAGHQYEISRVGQSAWEAANPQTAALTAYLQPGQSVLSDQVFDVPAQATDLGVILSHGFTPGYFVIGECPLFHKPTILRLSP